MQQFFEFVQHHASLFFALAVLVTMFLANEIHAAVAGGKRLAPLDAVRLINDRDALVVDVRPPADFKKGHLLNAVNLPLAKLEQQAGELGKDKAKPMVVYCALGGTAAEAAAKLRKLGYSEVYPLRGGINGWLGSNLPVTVK